MLLVRRRTWRPWLVKDPSAERTRVENLRVRRPVALVVQQQAQRVRRSGDAANQAQRIRRALWWRHNPPITIWTSVPRSALGVQQANRAHARRLESVYGANWQFVHTRWPRHQERVVGGEIHLTIRPRSTALTVGPRGDLTLRPRTTALTVGDR